MMLFIRDLGKFCGMEVYRVKKVKSLSGSCFTDFPSELMMTLNLWNS